MQKKLLAAAILAAVAGQAAATEVYSDETTSVTVGGYMSMKTKTTDSDTTLENDSSRINFGFAHKLTEDLTATAKTEWGFDDEDDFSARLNHMGVSSNKFGTVQLGKQWSVYSDVAGWTDVWAMNGGEVEGIYNGRSGDGGEHGTGRADDTVSYRVSVNGLNVGAQYQFRDITESDYSKDNDLNDKFTRKSGYGASVSYDFDFGLSVGVAYNNTDFGTNGAEVNRDDAEAAIVAVKYTRDAFHMAATYGEYKNHTNVGSYVAGNYENNFDQKSEGQALYISYNLNDNVKLESGYQNLETKEDVAGNSNKSEYEQTMVGAVYTTGPMQFAAQYIWDDSVQYDLNNAKKDNNVDDKVMLQARYYF